MKLLSFLLIAVILSACSSSGRRAPIVDRSDESKKSALMQQVSAGQTISQESDWRPQTYTVQKGDTLYSIALNYGFAYRELAVLNNLSDPNLIQIGQELRLFPTQAIIPRSAVVVQSLSEVEPVKAVIKEQPRLAKYKYSNTAIADIEKLQDVAPIVAVVVAPKPEKKFTPTLKIVKHKPKPIPKRVVAAAKHLENGELKWRAPSKGRIISKFSAAKNHKGIDFDGRIGRPVTASAAGKVVYSGSGLRGYGKLIIIKHNDTYLSAYAHNNRIVVKEGQMVARAQKIAEMGSTDTDRVKLHFEIRRFGKPVDPANYLPVER